jgi:hypothetical protein
LGYEAAELLACQDFAAVADRFGYALAYERPHAEAIRADFCSSISEAGKGAELALTRPTVTVKFFEPNDASLFALIECRLPFKRSGSVLAELIISNVGSDAHVFLEQIS